MGHVLRVRNLAIGQGTPKICVPLCGATTEELLKQAAGGAAAGADLLEWRADYFASPLDEAAAASVLRVLRATLGNLPLLVTLRSEREGGARAMTKKAYQEQVQALACAGGADLVDIEAGAGPRAVKQLAEAAHAAGVQVVLSAHLLQETPSQKEMVDILRSLRAQGGDIPKLAVTPGAPADVLALLAAAETYAREYADTPFIAIAMGRLGAMSRLSGGLFGSAVTFAAAGQQSAPGQLPVGEMAHMLKVFYEEA